MGTLRRLAPAAGDVTLALAAEAYLAILRGTDRPGWAPRTCHRACQAFSATGWQTPVRGPGCYSRLHGGRHSLVNVAITVRATSGGSLQQWRRTEVRPAVARILALSDQAMREQHHAMCLHRDRFGLGVRGPYEGDQADKLRAEERDHWKNSRDARQKLSFEVAQGYNLAAACLSG